MLLRMFSTHQNQFPNSYLSFSESLKCISIIELITHPFFLHNSMKDHTVLFTYLDKVMDKPHKLDMQLRLFNDRRSFVKFNKYFRVSNSILLRSA